MRALMISEANDQFTIAVQDHEPTATSPEDLLIRVDYSGVNFKDAMVATAASRVRRVPRLAGGVDAAGVVESSHDAALAPGTRVAVHGGNLGVARDGGFAEFVYAPSTYLSALPDSLSTRDAMIIGTAGISAMASVLALENHDLSEGEVLVTGATGGVGSMAIAFLAARGHAPVASTGSLEEAEWLLDRGATRVIGRDEIADKPDRVLAGERWAGAVDCIGGDTLHQILRSLRYGAAVAASGLVAGTDLTTTIYPFITRSVSLLGIDVVEMRAKMRAHVWQALGETAPRVDFKALVDREIGLDGLPLALEDIRHGRSRGRILVKPTSGA
ncbi:MAG TPA: acryloyl-CoA reductase [Acidimicrobiales bacterium]|nr:acryloyl-CoA reductase [Acidimicrobiales bacterium]